MKYLLILIGIGALALAACDASINENSNNGVSRDCQPNNSDAPCQVDNAS